jgi:hypothetical protein
VGLAEDLASALDPVVLAERVQIEPDPWQGEVLRSTHPRLLLNCCRQSGKSTTAALLGVHTAFYQPGSSTLLVSPGQRQSQELFRKALGMYRYLGRPISAEAENAMSLRLDNGSVIVSMPGNESTVRGYSADLLIIDEAARVSDELYGSVLPMLAVTGGRMITMSTPFGQSGWWARAWYDTGERWQRVKITADQCPRITPEILDEAVLELGEWKFRQEYYCEFMSDQFSVFREEDIQAIANPALEEWKL